MDFFEELVTCGLRDLLDPATTRGQCELFAKAFAEGCDPLLTCNDCDELAATTAHLSTAQQILVWFNWTILRTPLSLDEIRDAMRKTLREAGESDDLAEILRVLETEEEVTQ